MVYVTVLLLRCGENQVDVFGDYEPPEETTSDDDNILLSPSPNDPYSSPSSSPQVVKSSFRNQKRNEEDEDVVNVSDDDEEEEDEDVKSNDNDKKSLASNDSHDKEEAKDAFDTQERGQHIADQVGQQGNEQSTQSATAAKVEDDYDERPRRLRLSEYIDPFLTQNGYRKSKDAFTSLMTAISQSTTEERRMACFSAPTKACAGTAYMMGCSNLNQYNNLRWQLSTKSCLQAPCAIPIVVHNSLCTKDPRIDPCGGDQPVIDAGLLHCSASPWNDARQKCPFSLIVKKFKQKIRTWVQDWKEEEDQDQQQQADGVKEQPTDRQEQSVNDPQESVSEPQQEQEQAQVHEDQQETEAKEEQNNEEDPEEPVLRPRRVLDIQYFRLDEPGDPWSLKPMVLKSNALVDLIDPFRYMTPPRKGNLGMKRDDSTERPGPAEAVQQGVWWARQVGCDVVIMVVGEAAMQELAKAGGLLGDDDQLEVPPCSLATLIADVPDPDQQTSNQESDEDNDGDEEDILIVDEDAELNENDAGQKLEKDNNQNIERDTDRAENDVKDHSDSDGNDDSEQANAESVQGGDDSEEEEVKIPDYDYTQIRLGFHGFFTIEDLMSDPSQVIPAYTGPVNVLVDPPVDNNPMDIPVNQWSVFSPPKPENIPPDYPELPPFSQALQLPLPKRSAYNPPQIQYEQQISPLVPPTMPNPYMSPQRYGVPFMSPDASSVPPRDWQDDSLDQPPQDVRVHYGQGPSYHEQPHSPHHHPHTDRGPAYPPPQQYFGQPYPSVDPQPYRGPFYPPEPPNFQRPPYSPSQQRQQPYRGPMYSPQQPHQQFEVPPYSPGHQQQSFRGPPYSPQQQPHHFQGQQYPPQRYYDPNFQGQPYSPSQQPYERPPYPTQNYNNQGQPYPRQQYPPQQQNFQGHTPPTHHYSPNSRDRYASTNYPHGGTPPSVAPPDWDDA